MKKIIVRIDGMMCGMCEAHINDALRNAFPSLRKVNADRKKKQAVILNETDLDEEKVKKAVQDTGYTFLSMSSEEYRKKGLFGF